jgi:hypothetical protein
VIVQSTPHIDLPQKRYNAIVLGVGGMGGTGKVTLFDSSGAKVAQKDVSFAEGGRKEVQFEGVEDLLEPGRYTYTVELVDDERMPVEVQTFSRLQINGVRYGPGGPVLMSGDLEIPLSNVVEVLAARG